MKTSIWNRVLVTILCLVLLAVCVVSVLAVTQVIPMEDIQAFLTLMTSYWVNALIVGLVAVVLVLICLKLLFSGVASSMPQSALLKVTDQGMIRISLVALDSLVQKHVRSKNAVREVRSTIVPAQDAISIRLRLVLMPDANVPELTTQLQNSLREYVEKQSGIRVQEVLIYVENMSVNPQSRVD